MNLLPKKVADHYNRVARVYDLRYDTACGREYHRHICAHMLDWLPPGRLLLDLGCGTGLFMRRYGELGGTAVGLDISRGMVEAAREQGGWFEYLEGTAEVLPFRDRSFDAVSCMLAFSYLEHPERMLGEAYRVLRPGGCLAVSTLSRNVITSLVPAIYRIGERMEVGRIGVGDFGERYYTEEELVGIFTGAGFGEVRAKRCSFAHHSLKEPIFDIARRVEPFIEKRVPGLAYNLVVSGRVPAD
ncbi:MAG TPA: methyltransferase domain-containing protein [Methanomicrobiales archaeon]|nr:methyltransferase domain-containing protein [Methanomicrobiales archaeon]